MEQIIQSFLTQIVTVLSGLAIAYLTLLITKATAKIKAEADKIKDDKQKALVDSAIDRVNDLVTKGVASAQQTLVADLKAQIALGNASKEDLVAIGKNVATTVYGQLSADTLNVLKLEIVDVQGYIADSVEAQVLALKGSLGTSITSISTGVATQPVVFNAPVVDIPVAQPTEVVVPTETPAQ